MITNPIMPIWLMILICIIFIIIRSKNKHNFIKQIIIVILLFLINLRIMIPSSNVQIVTNNLDVLFVIDNTISILAEDYKGNTQRLTAIKKDCNYIIDQLNGARFSVITFSNASRIITPYIKDANLTIEAINTIQVMEELYSQGSSLNVVIEDTIHSLEASAKKPDRNRIIFFISDGEITNDDILKSFSGAKKYVDNGAVLGYGTSKGGYMRVTNNYTNETNYIEDKATWPYVKALSKIDENNLKKISQDMGIDYINMEKQSNLDYKLKEIKQKLQNTGNETKDSYTDIYYIFALPLCLILIYEFINYKRRILV